MGCQFEAILKHTMEKNGDLKEICDRQSIPHYYSNESMVERYANILIQKGGDSLVLMAEMIRENLRSTLALFLLTSSQNPHLVSHEKRFSLI